MGRAYSQDLRERVMAAVESGTGAYVVASVFQGSVSYIYKALGRRRTTEESSARRRLTGSISWKEKVYP